MTEIVPAYKKGDVVYAADTAYAEKYVACPDCLGTLKWTIIFADGDAREIECQTCRRGYEPACGKLAIKEWRTGVVRLTIGNVRYDDSSKQPFSYMCDETGVGSGRIYYEEDLFATREQAESRASQKLEEQLKHIAQNNFKKRDSVEDMLSTFGFTRSQAVEHSNTVIRRGGQIARGFSSKTLMAIEKSQFRWDHDRRRS